MAIAIFDFGTNIFNLLIAERKERGFKILYTGKQPVKLGQGGIHSSFLTPDAFERGFAAIQNHMEVIRRFKVEEIRAFATSAIRNAMNGEDFVEEVRAKFGFRTRIISGEREAELIYKGVRQSIRLTRSNVMILDIGGGSNEFIICNQDGICWKQSFELGMARILELFTLSDPITEEEISAIESYFQQGIAPLMEVVNREAPMTLIGASGAFDTFHALIQKRTGKAPDGMPGRELPMKEYQKLHKILLQSTARERLAMPGMEPVRVEMIVPASIFVSFVLRECRIGQLYHSEFSLKEGVISELLGL
jgi:exopolyphosphatase/guanosine-5'-triphosphate,3'-diphosphate pyrophosphatase